MAQVEKRDDCLIYLGCLNGNGYGIIYTGHGKSRLAHRLVWREHNPDAPEPQVVMHSCDTPACVDIRHLRAGTKAENSADMAAKGRAPRMRGERSGKAKLTALQVAEIRSRRAAGATIAQLGLEYGVHPAHISRISTGRRRFYD